MDVLPIDNRRYSRLAVGATMKAKGSRDRGLQEAGPRRVVRRTVMIQNRQRVKKIDTKLLKQIALHILLDRRRKGGFELGIRLVGATEMAQVNEAFLQHTGSTDVITFDYRREQGNGWDDHAEGKGDLDLHGEIFICIDDAISQAKEFRTTWQSELARYVVHGILHLEGFDDLEASLRREMKREENRMVRVLGGKFVLSKLAKRS